VSLPVTIVGWGTAVPDGRVTNADLEARVETSDAWIVERTGIRERRVAADGETTATLGTAAAAQAIKRAGLTPADIDLMIVATATPERGSCTNSSSARRCSRRDTTTCCSSGPKR
jgi:3-oxoacyl-[acyl-carrier-protein] synthase-3